MLVRWKKCFSLGPCRSWTAWSYHMTLRTLPNFIVSFSHAWVVPSKACSLVFLACLNSLFSTWTAFCRPWFTSCANSYWDVLRHFFHQPLYRDYHSMLQRFCVTSPSVWLVHLCSSQVDLCFGPQRLHRTCWFGHMPLQQFRDIASLLSCGILWRRPILKVCMKLHISHLYLLHLSLGCNTHWAHCARNHNVLSGIKDLLPTGSPTTCSKCLGRTLWTIYQDLSKK